MLTSIRIYTKKGTVSPIEERNECERERERERERRERGRVRERERGEREGG
jgi:hypothetical protein